VDSLGLVLDRSIGARLVHYAAAGTIESGMEVAGDRVLKPGAGLGR
jgi:hypothetical protein